MPLIYFNYNKTTDCAKGSHLKERKVYEGKMPLYHLDVYRIENSDTDFELEEYWRFVERGRKAGSKQPPIAPIEKWIKIKPIVPRPRNGKIPSTKQMAFAISKSIGKNGIKGKYPLSNTLKSTNVTNIVDQIKSTIIEKINIEIKHKYEQEVKEYHVTMKRNSTKWTRPERESKGWKILTLKLQNLPWSPV